MVNLSKITTNNTFLTWGQTMKLLRITAEGLPLFKEKLDLIFYAQQRVRDEDKENLHLLFSNVYLNPANAFIGINASGKTSVLRTFPFMWMLLDFVRCRNSFQRIL